MIKKLSSIFLLILFLISVCACDFRGNTSVQDEVQKETETEEKLTVVGFSQLGAESDWRSANSQSMRETFTEENGYKLLFEDGQQKQANQIMAIRKFIQQEVDYIVLAPVCEEGWDTVLQEAKEANIPVIIVDRMVKVSDESLFNCWVGSDFELEGLKLAEWLNAFCDKNGIAAEDVHIVNIQGSMGSSAQIGRTSGLRKTAKKYGWDLMDEVCGDFTQVKGREVMTSFLKKYDNINVVYCENDNEAFGAIEAIEAAGKKVGSNIARGEIMVISFDGVKQEAIDDVLDDKITCIAECNPLHGPRVLSLISTLKAGGTPEKLSYVNEDIFTANNVVTDINVSDNDYKVTIISR